MRPFFTPRLAAIAALFAGFQTLPAQAWEPLRAHPQNPYIFEFRNQPAVLRTYGEHYSSVINTDFDFIPYLDVLKRDEMNLTRIFLAGFRLIESDSTPGPLAPAPAQFLQPWIRSNTHGTALDGLGKWDLSSWNPDYFSRLDTFLQACSDRGIVAELTLFCTFYNEGHWQASPFNPANNVQGIGPANRYEAFRASNPGLMGIQESLVRKIVREVNRFDNIYFEIENEPFWDEPGIKDDKEVLFHNTMLGIIRNEEAALENRHLVAHNFSRYIQALSPDFDILNEHYPVVPPNSPMNGAEALLQDHYGRDKILALGETHTPTSMENRLESWMFLLGGGGIYNGVDIPVFAYKAGDEAGDTGAGRAFRGSLRNAGTYLDNLHLTGLRRNLSWVSSGIPDGASLQAMANIGQQYVAYFHHGRGGPLFYYDLIDTSDHTISPTVSLPAGSWRAVWTRPSDLAELGTEEFTHPGGDYTLAAVVYQEDIALRIDRTGAEDAVPPPRPNGLAAVSNADGSIALSWDPVQAADLASYHLYRNEVAGAPTGDDQRIATVLAPGTTFTDTSATVGVTIHYVLKAVDLAGNESSTSMEITATPGLRSLPFGGTPGNVPGTIQAEDFDTGGQDVAYNDLTPANSGGEYRNTESVDLGITNDEDGGFHIQEAETGEWLKYTIHVDQAGAYVPAIRVAAETEGSRTLIEVNGTNATGVINIPETGGTEVWQTLTLPTIELPAGDHVLRLLIVETPPGSPAAKFNWISFSPVPHVEPIANAGDDFEVVDQDGSGFETATLDSSASIPGDVPITSIEWFENGLKIASGANPSVNLATGSHTIQLALTDERGHKSQDEITVTVSARSFMNGGFESGFEGWSFSGNQSIETAYPTPHGTRVVAFNGGNRSPNGVLSQTFATTPGEAYLISFEIGTVSYNTSEQRLQVDAGGNTARVTQTFSVNGAGSGITRWTTKSFTFVADSPSSTITFRDRSSETASIDLLLDHVRMTSRTLRTLRVESSPGTGVNVTVTPPDEVLAASGATSFNRSYMNGTVVDLTAPPTASGYRFESWLKNGAPHSNNRSTSITMDATHTLTAVYVETAPIITSQPVGTNAGLNGTATFRVTAEGTGTLTYQWRFEGNDIPGATADTYMIGAVQESDGGTYDVVVSNGVGPVTSNPAVLTTLAAYLANGSFENGYEGWTASGNQSVGVIPSYVPSDGTRVMAFNGGNTVSNGVVSRSFSTTPGQSYLVTFDMGVVSYSNSEQVLQADLTGTSVLATRNFSINGVGSGNTRWETRTLAFTANSTATTLTFRDRSTITASIDLLLDNIRLSSQISRALTVESSPNAGVIIAVSPPDANNQANATTTFTRQYADATVVNLTAPPAASGYRFDRWLRNGALHSTSASTSVTMDRGQTLTAVYVESAPVITSHPVSTNAGLNGSATFRVTAEGTGTLSYQWRFNGNDIPGATTDTFTIPSVQTSDGGSYDVVVSNAVGPVTSNPATLTLLTTFLANGSFENGYDGWIASGNQNIGVIPSYVPSSGTRVIAFNGGNTNSNGVVSQTFGTTPGQSYLVTFDMGVVSYNNFEQLLQVDLTGTSVLANRTFSINGVGSGNTRWETRTLAFTANSPATTLTFRDRSTVTAAIDLLLDNVRLSSQISRALVVESSPNTGVPVTVSPPDSNNQSGATTTFTRQYSDASVVNLTAPPAAGGYRFDRWLKNGALHSTSASTSITMDSGHTLTATYVVGAPAITSQPEGVNATIGGSATFTVTAESPLPVTYQWRFNGNNITDAVANSLTIANVQAPQIGSYDVIVSNTTGSTISSPAALAVVSTGLANSSFEAAYQGWNASGNQNIAISPSYTPTDGIRLVVFNGGNATPNGSLAQTFATFPGQRYTLHFDMGVIAYNLFEQRLQVDFTGSSLLASQVFVFTGDGSGKIRWSGKSLSFTANSASTTLTIRDRSPVSTGLDLLLDHVRLSASPGAQATAAPAAAPSMPQAPSISAITAPPVGVPSVSPSLSKVEGGIRVAMVATEARPCQLQRSGDLKKWVPVGEIQWAGPGPIALTDDAPPPAPVFYRIALHPITGAGPPAAE